MSKKWIVYKRIVDLKNEKLEKLEKYNLHNKQYIYIGQCEHDRFNLRTNDFIYKIWGKTDDTKTDIEMRIELETAVTYQNIIKFYMDQKDMTKKEAENYLFRNKKHLIILNEVDSLEISKQLERKEYDTCFTEQILLEQIIVLPNRDTQLYTVQNENNTEVKVKSSKVDNFTNISFNFNPLTNELKINDSVIQFKEVTIKEVEYDIIDSNVKKEEHEKNA